MSTLIPKNQCSMVVELRGLGSGCVDDTTYELDIPLDDDLTTLRLSLDVGEITDLLGTLLAIANTLGLAVPVPSVEARA